MKSTVKSEIKTLADIVKSEKMSYTAKNIHWTVKSADSDDQRCKAVVVFGLQAEGQNGRLHPLVTVPMKQILQDEVPPVKKAKSESKEVAVSVFTNAKKLR